MSLFLGATSVSAALDRRLAANLLSSTQLISMLIAP